ncbi:MAG: matrixin family metalloprotease [Baekduiaceae bacterium]
MLRRLFILTCCVAASVPTTASAFVLDRNTGPFTNPPSGGLRASVPISGSAAGEPFVPELWKASVRYWGGVPESCAEGIETKLSTEDSDADPADTETSAWVYDNELCAIYLNVHNTEWPITAETAYTWCAVITHEAGHMHGLSHSKNKHNLMYGGWIPDATPECNRFTIDGEIYLPKIDDPYYDKRGRRRTAAQRRAYERRKAARAQSRR